MSKALASGAYDAQGEELVVKVGELSYTFKPVRKRR